MPLNIPQKLGSSVWYYIQNENREGLSECLADNFEGKAIGVMDGNPNIIPEGKKEMIATAMVVGKAVNAIGDLKFNYGMGVWSEKIDDIQKHEIVYLIAYEQKLLFTPTTIPSHPSLEADDIEKKDEVKKQSFMFSRGLQVWKWAETEDKTQFTSLWSFEVDQTKPIDTLLGELKTKGQLSNVVLGNEFVDLMKNNPELSLNFTAVNLNEAIAKAKEAAKKEEEKSNENTYIFNCVLS